MRKSRAEAWAKTLKTRFLEKCIPEPNTGCWLWIGSMWSGGYGQIRINNRMRFAHRVSWEIHRGEIPDGDGFHGVCVLHKCDVRCCVNPDHLFLGTQQDNMDDMARKKRKVTRTGARNGMSKHPERSHFHGMVGERSYTSVLTNAQVREIKSRLSTGETQSSISKSFGIHSSTVSRIKTGDIRSRDA